MPYILNQPLLAQTPPYVFFEGEFSPEECQKIIAMSETMPFNQAVVGSDVIPIVDRKIRSSKVGWIEWTPESDWIYIKLSGVANKVRSHWYPFVLSGFLEPMQLTQYTADEEGHYDLHKDIGPGAQSVRKLSCVVLLSPPTDFEGGNLELPAINGEDKAVKELKQGTVICFPSYELHRVTKVLKGTRWSLVSWISGPPFI